MSHWCRDIPRDEAVRAAEDNRQGPLPTLEAVIAQPFAEPAKCSPALSETGDGQSGMRTERVTLEVTHFNAKPAAEWVAEILHDYCEPGESVRVVEETHFDDLANMAMARDAARRERDELRTECERLRVAQVKAAQERDKAHEARGRIRSEWERRGNSLHVAYETIGTLKARVAELEGCDWVPKNKLEAAPAASEWRILALGEIVKDGDEYLQSDGRWLTVALRHKIREQDVGRFRRRVSAPAASGAANSSAEPKSSEPDAWGVMRNGKLDAVTYLLRSSAELAAEGWGGTVVPLYTFPPPARGWLTEQERSVIEEVLEEDGDRPRAETFRHLLARSTPPEVMLPGDSDRFRYGDDAIANRDRQWLAALAAAGVAVKEVG